MLQDAINKKKKISKHTSHALHGVVIRCIKWMPCSVGRKQKPHIYSGKVVDHETQEARAPAWLVSTAALAQVLITLAQ
jgi:hypothetical protein